jgi:hypothetical protein
MTNPSKKVKFKVFTIRVHPMLWKDFIRAMETLEKVQFKKYGTVWSNNDRVSYALGCTFEQLMPEEVAAAIKTADAIPEAWYDEQMKN